MNILSLGAGVQSSTILLMSLCGELPPLDGVIFADTGWEPARVYAHLDYLEGECQKAGLPLYRVNAGNLLEDAYDKDSRKATVPLHVRNEQGKPGIIRRQCTSDYKLEPIRQKVRELLGVAKRQRVPKHISVNQWIGISLDEAHRMKDSGEFWRLNVYPLIERRMTRHDCLLWLQKNGYPIPPKSACVGCPFHDNAFWRDLKDNSPQEWQQAVAFDEHLRNGFVRIGKEALRGKAFVHRDLIPLSEVDLSTSTEKGQLDLFGNECEGLCGV